MLKYCLIVIYGILCVAAVIKISRHNGREKSVNLALETVFEFDNDDKKNDVNILNKVQRFIGKVKHVIENSQTARRQLSDTNVKVFTNFIIDFIQILIQYDDKTLENIASIISEEMVNHQYDGCKFYELTDNIEQQKPFAKNLKEIKFKAGVDIKNDLKAISNKLSEEIYAKPEKELLDVINTVYQDYSLDKLHKFLKGIDDYRQNSKDNNNITKVISEGLKTILFDHYTNLTIHLRTSLLSKFQNYMKYYNENLVHKVTAVTKNKQALRTLRQVYIEKESPDESDHVKRASKTKTKKQTSPSQRPLNVPTTKKSKSEYSKEILRSNKYVRHNKKYRFMKISKTSEENPAVIPKKQSSGTTKELRTLRQMYVEKNIDLKYDPDAYKHLTTAKKSKTKKPLIYHSNSPTTHKRTYKREKLKRNKPNKYIDKSQYEKQPKVEDSFHEYSPDKSDKSVERILTDFVIDFSSEAKTTTPFKLTKMTRFFGQTFIDKDLEYYENTPGFRSEKKKLTFKTLYPTFVIDWTTPVRHGKRQFGGMSEFKVRSAKHEGDGGHIMNTHRPGSGSRVKLEKNLDYSIEVRRPKNLELGVHKRRNKKSSRHQHENQHEDKPKIRSGHLKKAVKHHSVHAPVLQRHDMESVDEKPKKSRDPMILARQYELPLHSDRKKIRRHFTKLSVGSEEGLSIEGLKTNTRKIYYRRNNSPNTTENFEKNVQVLRRIENLENEIELVKIRIKNDTYAKRVLSKSNSNVKNKAETLNNVNSVIHKANSMTKATEGTTTRRDENMGEVPEKNNANPADGQIKDISEKKDTNNHMFNKQSVVTEREFIERKPDYYQHKSQSSTTQTVQESYTLDSIKDKDRKAYPSFEKTQDMITDKGETDVKSEKTIKSQNNKHVENEAYENNMRKSIKEIDKKDKEITSKKGTSEKSFYFRNNEVLSDIKFNASADESVKHKYSPKLSHIKDDSLHNGSDNSTWVEVVYRERQFKNKNDEKQAKENEIKDYTKPHKDKSESNNLKDRTSNLRVYEDFVFRATDGTQNSTHTTLGSTEKNGADLFKGIEETTVDIIAGIENNVRKQTSTANTATTVTEAETTAKQLKKEDKRTTGDGNTVQNQKEEKNKEELSTTPSISNGNDALVQKLENNTIVSNVTVT